MKLTAGDMLVLNMLLWHVRVARMGELVRAYRTTTVTNASAARRRVRELVAAGLIQYAKVLCRPVLRLERPLYCWSPVGGPPAFDRSSELAWRLEKRWSDVALKPACVYFAGKKAINLFGGVATGSVKSYLQLSHDCQVSWVYCRYLESDPDLAATWVSEDAATEHVYRQRRPDAVLHDSMNRPVLAVEIGGFYGPEKLVALMRDLERRQLALELW